MIQVIDADSREVLFEADTDMVEIDIAMLTRNKIRKVEVIAQ